MTPRYKVERGSHFSRWVVWEQSNWVWRLLGIWDLRCGFDTEAEALEYAKELKNAKVTII